MQKMSGVLPRYQKHNVGMPLAQKGMSKNSLINRDSQAHSQTEPVIESKTETMAEPKTEPTTSQAAQPAKFNKPVLPPMSDLVDIPHEEQDKADEFREKLENMRAEMAMLREQLRQAGEVGEGMAEAWREKIKCMIIAMRIMKGDNVPEQDHRFLRDRDIELYARAISLRIEKEDPYDHDRLSDDEDFDSFDIIIDCGVDMSFTGGFEIQSAESAGEFV
jgi:hypothetical protein